MQNVWRLSNRNMFRYKVNYLNYLHNYLTHSNQNFRQCLNHNQIYRFFGFISQNTLRRFQRKYKVVHSILIRSLFETSKMCKLDHYRYFSNQSTKLNKDSLNNSNDYSSDQEKNRKRSEKDEKLVRIKLYIALAVLYALTATVFNIITSNAVADQAEHNRIISWNEFLYQFLAKGEVQEIVIIPEIDTIKIVVHNDAIIKGRKTRAPFYVMYVPDAIKTEEKIREAERNLGIQPEHGVPISYQRSHFSGLLILIIGLLMALFWGIRSRLPQIREMPPKFYSHMTQAKFTLVDPLTGKGKGVKFSDVAGLREAKIEIMEFVDYLRRPDNYKILGAKLPKGTLLLGPPGCGKTLLAKAVATEANVPFLSMNGSEFTEIVGGLGAARIRNLFDEAKKRAPSIIYIDEIDTIGRKRLDTHFNRSTDESEQTLNQLLTEMDGMATRQDVIVLASTNRSEVLDKALLRRGRFDRHILIDYPDLSERKEIFELHLKKLKLNHEPSVNSEKLASMTPGCTGADIANMCNEAALRAARLMKNQVEYDDLQWATERVLNGAEKRNSTILRTEKRIIAFHEAGHAIAGWMLQNIDDLYKVSIVQRTNNKLGIHTYREKKERNMQTLEELEDWICHALAGRVAENLCFNVVSTSAQDDLEEVKKIAYMIVQQMGMNKSIGLISFTDEQLSNTRKFYSKIMGNMIDQEVRKMVAKLYKKTEELLIQNKDKLKLLAEALLEKESLTYEEVKQLIGPRELKQEKNIILNLNN